MKQLLPYVPHYLRPVVPWLILQTAANVLLISVLVIVCGFVWTTYASLLKLATS